MAMKTGMYINFDDFNAGIKKLVTQAEPQATAKGLFAAGNALLNDAIYQVPKAPFKEGTLRGSARADAPVADRLGAEVLVGFNIVYAHRWHELTPEEDSKIDWSLPGSGRKFLETKMARNKEKYLRIVGNFLKRVLGG
jgi:hypothetical protein